VGDENEEFFVIRIVGVEDITEVDISLVVGGSSVQSFLWDDVGFPPFLTVFTVDLVFWFGVGSWVGWVVVTVSVILVVENETVLSLSP